MAGGWPAWGGRHLKQLVDAGLLTREQRGRWPFYRVVDGALASLADALRVPAPVLRWRARVSGALVARACREDRSNRYLAARAAFGRTRQPWAPSDV